MFFINKAKKSLGQNFLIDQNISKKIIKIINITKNKKILEIGSVYGSLTDRIIELSPKKIIAVEKDKDLANLLKQNFENLKNIEIINDDILKILQNRNMEKNITVFGNLPYNISTKILTSLILTNDWPPWYDVLVFMFQKEVADRIVAKNNSKNFGRLSILCNWRLEIKKHFNVSRNCFFPKPNVDSTVLSFIPKTKFFNIKNPKNLENITRILFSNRRKIIKKNFIKLFGKNNIADDLNLDLNKRPEELTSETFYKIAIKYEELFG